MQQSLQELGRLAVAKMNWLLFFLYLFTALGIPGNILSAIVWLRRHVTGKNSSAIYLGVLAINDLVFLLAVFVIISPFFQVDVLHYISVPLSVFTATLEPLLVLGFSIERLIAIHYPLQVC